MTEKKPLTLIEPKLRIELKALINEVLDERTKPKEYKLSLIHI